MHLSMSAVRLSKRDVLASGLVATALAVYLLQVAGAAPGALDGTREAGATILGLGFLASASAVVPSFADLLHGNHAYLAVTSLIGVVAFAAGVHVLVTANAVALGVLMASMLALWVIATIHHSLLTSSGQFKSVS